MENTTWVLITLLSAVSVCDAYKLLVVFPVPGTSHNILGNAVVKHLLDAGHEVTYITPITNKNPHPKLQQIDVSSNLKLWSEDLFNIENLLRGQFDLTDPTVQAFIFHTVETETLQNENVQKFLSDKNQQFDAVIAEWMLSELYSGLAGVYNVPLIWFSSTQPFGQVLSLIDEFLNTAYTAMLTDAVPPFTFGERVSELWETVKLATVKQIIIGVSQWWQYKNLIVPHIEARGRVPYTLNELKYNASLMIGNAHPSLGQAIRMPQSYIQVGGYHIPKKYDALPENLQNIMDNAKNGVIYFSMGSNIKSKTLPDVIKKDILKVFGNLKQTVFWKFEEELPNKPANVHILKWAPQQSILAHPNCVLFITHGGQLSLTEAIHFGVPIIGIPVFGDQFTNVKRAVNKNYAKKVTLSYTMGDEFMAAIEDILTNPIYTHKVKELSFVYHDRTVPPAVELVHWVEHVIKTNGAPHLRSAALLVPWYQKAYLDLALLLAALIYVLRKLFKLALSKMFPKRVMVKQKRN